MNLIVSIYFWKVEVDLQIYWLVERVGKYNGMKRLQIFKWWFQSSAFFRVSAKSYVLMQKTKAKKQTNKKTWKKSNPSNVFFWTSCLAWELRTGLINHYGNIFWLPLCFLFLFSISSHLALAKENRSWEILPQSNQTCQLERRDCQVPGAGWQFVSTSCIKAHVMLLEAWHPQRRPIWCVIQFICMNAWPAESDFPLLTLKVKVKCLPCWF